METQLQKLAERAQTLIPQDCCEGKRGCDNTLINSQSVLLVIVPESISRGNLLVGTTVVAVPGKDLRHSDSGCGETAWMGTGLVAGQKILRHTAESAGEDIL